MKKQKQPVCPGCSRHCTADAIRCKRGRAYFAALQEKESAPDAEQSNSKSHSYKWEKYVTRETVLWRLFFTVCQIKRALRSEEITESSLLSLLTEAEKEQLTGILSKLTGRKKS